MPEMTEEKVYSALGQNVPEGENGTEVAAPPEKEPTGVGTGPQAQSADAVPTEQTPEERHRNAARRREREREALFAEAQRAAEERLASKQADFPDLPRGGVEELVRREVERVRREDAQNAADKERIERDFETIRRFDPTVRDVGDLLRMENADTFRAYVDRGYSFADAYKLTHFEKLTEASAAAAKAAALESVRSREHLTSVTPRGTGSVPVPSSEMRMFRLLNPTASDEEITRFYNQERKN